MTLEEFDDNVETWDDLEDFCDEVGIRDGELCSIYYEVDDYVDDRIANWDDSWYDLRDYLDDVPTGYTRYYVDDDGDIAGTDSGDDTFYDFKDNVRIRAIGEGLFDEENDEDDDNREDDDDTPVDEVGADGCPVQRSNLWNSVYTPEKDEAIKSNEFSVETLFS